LLHRFELDPERPERPVSGRRTIWEEAGSLYSLAVSPDGTCAVLGGIGTSLSCIDLLGRLLWRRSGGYTSSGRTWAVCFGESGNTVYAGCSAGSEPVVMALDAGTGRELAVRRALQPVTLVAPLPRPLAVATAQVRGRRCSVVAYQDDLRGDAWTVECEPDEVVTAMAPGPHPGTITLGTNTGHLRIVQAADGATVGHVDLLFSSTVLSLASARGSRLAAGMANGHVAALEPLAAHRESSHAD
jgi:hypothetical protein